MKPLGLIKALPLSIIASLYITPSAQAAIIDFSGYSTGDTGLTSLTVGDATFEVIGGTVYTYAPGFGTYTNGAVCALTGSFTCETDMTMTFSSAVTDLSFHNHAFDFGDYVEIYAYNGATLVDTKTITGVTSIDFGSAVITSLFFDDSSTGAGFGFGDFTYNAAVVPIPAAAWLFSSVLIGLVSMARRRSN